ncbi:MAG: hypothetical protein ACLFOY_09125 [Desulfatibacillaceae bacterium]
MAYRYDNQNQPQGGRQNGMFREFEASELYCSRCRQAVPVRKRLLLVLPDSDLYEYLCAHCGESVGTKTDRSTFNPG